MILRIAKHKPSKPPELSGAKEDNRFPKLTQAPGIKMRKHIPCIFSKMQKVGNEIMKQ